MRKNLLYSTIVIIGLITAFITYFSVFGFKTERFNDFIKDKVNIIDPKLSVNINDVFLKLNIKEKSINIDTQNAILHINEEFINLDKINLSLDILKYFKKENSIKNIRILSKKNKIKNITDFLNSYKFSIPRLIIYNQIKDGNIEFTLNVNVNDNSKNKITYDVKGKISEGRLNVFDNIKIKDINFNFYIKDNKYDFKKASFNYQDLKFNSKEILIKKFNKTFEIEGDVESNKGPIDRNTISKIFNINLDVLENKKILAKTSNKFKFIINAKRELKNLDLVSKIDFKEILINKKIQNLISFQDGFININYKKNFLNIDIDSGYSFIKDEYKNNEEDNIKINITKKNNEDFKVEAFIKNENNSINSNELSNYIKNNNIILEDQKIIFGSTNQIVFSLDDKNKIENLIVKSNLNIQDILINYKSSRLSKIFPDYKNIIKIKNTILNIDYSKNKKSFLSKGDYSFNDKYDKFNFKVLTNKNDLNFESNVEIVSNQIVLEDINYKKEKNNYSEIKINGQIFKDKKIKLQNISLVENENNFSLSNLYLSNNYKIIDLDKLQLIYLNNNKKLNKLKIFKENNKFKLFSDNFDGKSIIKNILKGDSKTTFLKRFKNLNSELILNFDHFFIDSNDYLKNIRGSIIIEKNKIKYGNITAKLNNKNDFNLNIKINSKNEKITNLLIDKPEPFFKHYKFIKGFNGGNLTYSSIEKNGINRSTLKIFDFKVKEVPVLAKILTLASLQGIADLLTGEGIRFDDFEMDYQSSQNLTEIKEMYAIGPAISILMSGYIEKEKLTSLRGTLVPATTINKTIAKIPLIGNLLVGKKTGEGVFGVSFKVKGPPKDLKTTVNPVKTLTPRFITRTLEKLKKN